MDKKEAKALEEVKRKNRFSHAFRGLYVFYKSTRNLKIHLCFMVLVIILGCYFSIAIFEWLSLFLAIGLVLVSEALNTAIEIDIDLTSPEYHPYARDTKDVAAGGVLIACFCAAIVGLIIFMPKFLGML